MFLQVCRLRDDAQRTAISGLSALYFPRIVVTAPSCWCPVNAALLMRGSATPLSDHTLGEGSIYKAPRRCRAKGRTLDLVKPQSSTGTVTRSGTMAAPLKRGIRCACPSRMLRPISQPTGTQVHSSGTVLQNMACRSSANATAGKHSRLHDVKNSVELSHDMLSRVCLTDQGRLLYWRRQGVLQVCGGRRNGESTTDPIDWASSHGNITSNIIARM